MRIYYPDKIDKIIEIKNSRFHKIASVLRMNLEDKIEIFDGKGKSYNSEIISISKKSLKLKILSENKSEIIDSLPEIHLAFSIVKPSRFEIAVEKTTEIGVHSIIPLVTEYTNRIHVNMFSKSRLKRFESISISAAEQCGTNYIPSIENPKLLTDLIKSDNNEDIRKILFYENLISNDVVIKNPKKNKKILIVIGPEGGFSKNELSLVEQSDFEIKSLGNNILRAETAAICAVNNVNLFINSAQ